MYHRSAVQMYLDFDVTVEENRVLILLFDDDRSSQSTVLPLVPTLNMNGCQTTYMMNDDLCILYIVQISCDEATQKSWSLYSVWMRVVIGLEESIHHFGSRTLPNNNYPETTLDNKSTSHPNKQLYKTSLKINSSPVSCAYSQLK
jgi:hypothetical protein